MEKSTYQENKSLKTFFVYAGIVLLFIFISLSIKLFFIIKASKFDGRHEFAFTITQKEKIKEIILFKPSQSKTITIQLEEERDSSNLNKELGFIPDATINTNDTVTITSDTPSLLRSIGFKYNSIKTDLTLLDILKLAIISHKTSNEQLVLKKDQYNDEDFIKKIFVDDEISSENISIQIINASGGLGIGKRLETSLSQRGCTIISVITSQKKEKESKIEYFGERTYTLEKVEKLLKFPSVKFDKKQIADVVIIIGEDYTNLVY